MKKLLQRQSSCRFTRWAAICAAGIMLMMCGITGRAAQTATANTDNVNVRTQASAESERVCKVLKSTELTVVDQTTGSDGNVWYSVTFTHEGTEKSGGRELYLVWASDGGGNQGWFYYDPQDRTFQREMGQFSGGGTGEPEGMIRSLQDQLAMQKEESAKSLSQRLYFIIGLGALSLILFVLVVVLAIKLRGAEYEYYDDEDEDDEDDDDYYEEEPKKKRGGLFRRKAKEDDEDDEDEKSDFDDLLVAVKKKWAEEEEREAYGADYEDEDDYGEAFEEPEEIEEDEEEFSEMELPEIDMSAVLEVEEKAAKEKTKKKAKAAEPDPIEEDMEDFDIEILDLDDLDL